MPRYITEIFLKVALKAPTAFSLLTYLYFKPLPQLLLY